MSSRLLGAECDGSGDGPMAIISTRFAEVVVVRHGETAWNASRIKQGGGESVNQFYQGAISAVERIARKHIGERIIVVTHGGLLRELYQLAVPSWSGK